MKVTLDHNCIIHLENDTAIGRAIRGIVTDPANECFVVNIGASEMRKHGVRPDNYEQFEKMLARSGIDHLPRLNPMAISDMTFYDHSVFSDDEMIGLAVAIQDALFGPESIQHATLSLDSPEWEKWLNRTCDIHGMWCHIRNRNDVFLTTDGNFKKHSKLPKLLALGAGRIRHPMEALS